MVGKKNGTPIPQIILGSISIYICMYILNLCKIWINYCTHLLVFKFTTKKISKQLFLGSIGIKPNHAILKNEMGKIYVEPYDVYLKK